jgi:hypothetical protein
LVCALTMGRDEDRCVCCLPPAVTERGPAPCCSAASRPAAAGAAIWRCGGPGGSPRTRRDREPHRPMIVLGPAFIFPAGPADEPIPD